MPTVLPFAGLRYTAAPAELERLVCPPYDVIDAAEQARLQALSPYNASYVELPADAPGQPGSRYRLAAERLAAWRRQRILAPDPRPAYYLSETEFSFGGADLRRRDVLAALEAEPWSTGGVLPHEHTMSAPKADRLELLRATHLNAAPIWVLHRQRLVALERAWAAADARPPTVEFTWRDERHHLWLIDDAPTTRAIAQAFERSGPLYIADGHHRYETSLAFRTEAEASLPGARAILTALTWADDPGLVALPTHRLLQLADPASTLAAAETRWAEVFQIEYFSIGAADPAQQVDVFMQRLAASGRQAPSFGVYESGSLDRFGILTLRDRARADALLPADRSAAWKSLDVSLLHSLLVDPLVVEDGRPREAVLSYTRHPLEAVTAVRAARAAVAFFLNPTPVSGVLAVADAHDRMPEKSTYFFPKPPAGLVTRDLEVSP